MSLARWGKWSEQFSVKTDKTASTNDSLPEISKMKYRIPEPGMTISVLTIVKKKKKN